MEATRAMTGRAWLAVLAVALMLGATWACRAEVAVPALTARVTDQTGTLTGPQRAALEQKLRDFEARQGSQVAVLLVPTTAPESIEQYALRVVERWQLGRRKVDDGALLIIAKNDRTLRIEVGYGLEGALTDATGKRIIAEVITPQFRRGDFYAGIDAGVDRMLRVIAGEPLPAPAHRHTGGGRGFESAFPLLLIATLVMGGALRAALGRFPGALAGGGLIALLTYFMVGAVLMAVVAGVIALLFILLGSGESGRRMGGFPGGLGGGGFGGGGFRGGGGGFGGGGASGRW